MAVPGSAWLAASVHIDGLGAQAARPVRAGFSAVGGDVYLEIVPSHLGIDFGVDVCRGHVEQIVEALPAGGRLEISAEESWRTPRIIELTLGLARVGAPLVATVQANLRRSTSDADQAVAL
jgi:proline dehydrogenase